MIIAKVILDCLSIINWELRMTDMLQQIMQEYDQAKEDASWDKDHPIFQMAQHIDLLKKKLSVAESLVEDIDELQAVYVLEGL